MIEEALNIRTKISSGWVREGTILAFFTLIALIFRQTVYVILYTDSIQYLAFAKNVLSGIHYGADLSIARYRLPPLYPHVIAFFSSEKYDLFKLIETGRQVSIIAGSLTVIPLYLLARRMFGIWAAIVSSFLLLLAPEFLYYSGSVLTESIAALFIVTSILFLWLATEKESHLSHYVLLGVFLGLAFLTRHAAIGFLGLSLIWILANNLVEIGAGKIVKSVSAWTLPVVLVMAGFLAVNSPQVFYLHSETGRWSLTGFFFADPSSNSQNAAINMPFTEKAGGESSLALDGRKSVLEDEESSALSPAITYHVNRIIDKPIPFIKNYIKVLFSGYRQDTRPLPYPGIILFLALSGFLILAFKRETKKILFLSWIFGGFFLFLALFGTPPDRYMFPVFPILLIIAGGGAALLAQQTSKLAQRKGFTFLTEPVFICVIIVSTFTFLFPAATTLIKSVNSAYNMGYYRAMQDELSPKIEPGAYIFDRNPHRAFFGGGYFVRTPDTSIKEVIKSGQSRGVRYWIVSSDYVGELYSQFLSLLTNPENYRDYLKPLGVYGNEKERTILFEIIPDTQ
jgi:hypothetical protein